MASEIENSGLPSNTAVGAPQRSDPVRIVPVEWTSDSNGDYTTTLDLNGVLLQVAFDPAAGAAAPTNGYDITCTNAAGIDVFGGLGSNLSDTTATQDTPVTTTNSYPYVLAGEHTFTVAGAGDGNSGVAYLFVR